MPPAASASSKGGIWALVRTSTAISSGSTSRPASRPTSVTSARASCSAISKAATAGSGPAGGAGQQPVGHGQHLRGGAVVVLQPHQVGVGEAPCEAGQVVGGRAGEGVDRLVLVADHRQVAPLPQPGVQQGLLQRVGVLVLVDREPAVAAADLLGDVLVLGDRVDGAGQHVLEVDPAGALL